MSHQVETKLTAKGEINVPIALSAFRDKTKLTLTASKILILNDFDPFYVGVRFWVLFLGLCVCVGGGGGTNSNGINKEGRN